MLSLDIWSLETDPYGGLERAGSHVQESLRDWQLVKSLGVRTCAEATIDAEQEGQRSTGEYNEKNANNFSYSNFSQWENDEFQTTRSTSEQ